MRSDRIHMPSRSRPAIGDRASAKAARQAMNTETSVALPARIRLLTSEAPKPRPENSAT